MARQVPCILRLSGDLTINRADVAADLPTPTGVVAMDVVERNRPVELAATLPPTRIRGDGWALDVKLHAPARVFDQGREPAHFVCAALETHPVVVPAGRLRLLEGRQRHGDDPTLLETTHNAEHHFHLFNGCIRTKMLPIGKIFQHEVGHELVGVQPERGGALPDPQGRLPAPVGKRLGVVDLQLEAVEPDSRQFVQAADDVGRREPVAVARNKVCR